jgi:bacillithiol system protein YtxJ
MRPDLKALRYLDDLDRLLEDSAHRPVLLFKHSYSCGTSAEALDELIAHLDEKRRHDTDYAVVTVQTHREISNAVSAGSACGTRRRRRCSSAIAAWCGARRTSASRPTPWPRRSSSTART